MKTRRLGREGPEVSALGLGCMAMSGTYGPADDAESVATIQEAIDRGITLLDTGWRRGIGAKGHGFTRAIDTPDKTRLRPLSFVQTFRSNVSLLAAPNSSR